MKGVVVVLLLAAGGAAALYLTRSSVEEFDPTEQGRQARAAVRIDSSWTEVLSDAGEPRYWRDDVSRFDFNYIEEFDPSARDVIARRLEQKDMPYGFSFLYKFSAAATFAVNFSSDGEVLNIQDKESKKDLMDDISR